MTRHSQSQIRQTNEKEVKTGRDPSQCTILDGRLLLRHRAAGTGIVVLVSVPAGEPAGVECPHCGAPAMVEESVTRITCDACGNDLPVPQFDEATAALIPSETSNCDIAGTQYTFTCTGQKSLGSMEPDPLVLFPDGTVVAEDRLERVWVYHEGLTVLWVDEQPRFIVCPDCGVLVSVADCRDDRWREIVWCRECGAAMDLLTILQHRFGAARGEELCGG